MSRPLEQTGDLTVPEGLATRDPTTLDPEDAAYESPPASEGESNEPFSNLKTDERHFEDQKKRDERRAQLVMGPPLGQDSANGAETVISGETLAENEDILADVPDDALDLELTHMRLRTLRGLGLERFKAVEVSSLGRSGTRGC